MKSHVDPQTELQDFPARKSIGEPKSLAMASVKPEKNELITLPINSVHLFIGQGQTADSDFEKPMTIFSGSN